MRLWPEGQLVERKATWAVEPSLILAQTGKAKKLAIG